MTNVWSCHGRFQYLWSQDANLVDRKRSLQVHTLGRRSNSPTNAIRPQVLIFKQECFKTRMLDSLYICLLIFEYFRFSGIYFPSHQFLSSFPSSFVSRADCRRLWAIVILQHLQFQVAASTWSFTFLICSWSFCCVLNAGQRFLSLKPRGTKSARSYLAFRKWRLSKCSNIFEFRGS